MAGKRTKSRKDEEVQWRYAIILIALGLIAAGLIGFSEIEDEFVPVLTSTTDAQGNTDTQGATDTQGKGTGNLLIWSYPQNAVVYVDDIEKGISGEDWMKVEQPAGDHTVKIILSGYEEFTKSVTVSAGKDERVEAVLTKIEDTPVEEVAPAPTQTDTLSPTYAPPVSEVTPTPAPTITSSPAAPAPTAAQQPASYISAYFKSSSTQGSRITVPQYSDVEIFVTLNGYGSGILKTELKADIKSWTSFDPVKQTYNTPVTLNGQQTVKVGTFRAEDLTGKDSFEQYYIKLYWDGKNIYDPTDRSKREAVYTLPSQTYKLQVATVGFSKVGGTTPQNEVTVSKGEPVKAYAKVSSGGSASGTITLQVRKESRLGYDKTYATFVKSYSMNGGEQWVNMGTFYPDEVTGWNMREYYARATTMSNPNDGTAGDWEYNPTTSNNLGPGVRPHVYVNN